MAGNGNTGLQNLEAELRNVPQTEDRVTEFTLAQMGHFLARAGADKQRLCQEFAAELLEMTRRELAYLERIVGKLK